jgi:hypothetical protein
MKTRGRWRSDHRPADLGLFRLRLGENVGWISLKGGSGATAYGVVTDFRQFEIYLPLVLKPS